MKSGRAPILLAACLTLQGVVLVGLVFAARAACAPSTLVTGFAISFLPYAGALVVGGAALEKQALDRIALLLALLFGGILVFAPPLLSDDLYRYVWEGRLWLEGLNPYRLAPDDAALAPLRDEIWEQVNNKSLATIYPPLSQALFVVAALLGGTVGSVKLLALLGHLLCVTVLAHLSDRKEAALAIAINPLLLSEGPLNGHFDILTGLALLLTAWALARRRFVQAGLAALAAIGLKLIGLLALPFFLRRPRVLLGTGLATSLLLLPLLAWRTPTDPVSGTGQFASRWRGNESLFAFFDWASRQLFPEELAGLAARCGVALVLLLIVFVLVRRDAPPLSALRALVWAVLLLSPQVHPWYLAWLLPLEVAAGGRAGLVWSAAVLCAYAPLDRWLSQGLWEMSPALQIFEYGLVFLALLLDPRRPSLCGEHEEREFPHDSRLLA